MYNQSQNSDDGTGCLIVALMVIYGTTYFIITVFFKSIERQGYAYPQEDDEEWTSNPT